MKGINLTFVIDEDEVPKYLTTDGNRLRQILINLISNAIKYTNYGSVTVEARREFSLLYISVIDTGVGIEKERQDGLFTAFTKIMRHRELNKEGVGLGLTICKNLT